MSDLSYRLPRAGAIVAALVIAFSFTALAERPEVLPREAVSVTRLSYVVVQNDEEKGAEEIVRTDFNDNTVTFEVRHTLVPTPEITMEQNTVFTVVDESFFPVDYQMTKKITHGDSGTEIGIDATMFANVAVYTTRSASAQGSRNIVLPTGTVFLETGVVYVYYQLLYAYNRETGGRQSFNTLNVDSGKPSTAVVQLVDRESVTVGDAEYEVAVFKVQREHFDITIYVDDDDRIVRVDQNFMMFDLVDWSREVLSE